MGVRGTTLALCFIVGAGAAQYAEAATPVRKQALTQTVSIAKSTHVTSAKRRLTMKSTRRSAGRHAGAGPGISCVPYARMVTGMAVSGNGGSWWYNAAGHYERGNRPQSGSVLAFRSSSGMSRGHVAVVSRVISPRQLLIDHANWGGPGIRRGSVMHDVNVVDVSPGNDWTEVRVQVGYDSGTFGRTYPTYGFIHNRPDNAILRAETVLRPLVEVAEMPERRR